MKNFQLQAEVLVGDQDKAGVERQHRMIALLGKMKAAKPNIDEK